jgi:hypothetical protein
MDYLEFIARVTSHIPDKGQVTVRYYGLYANAHRGKIKKANLEAFRPPMRRQDEDHLLPHRLCHKDVRSAGPAKNQILILSFGFRWASSPRGFKG